jgi:alanyl-tRNA synthetase
MPSMNSAAIRASFLDYFARHGHRAVASSSLVPTDDPTLLFTNAGMNQFKDVFLGKESRSYTRATTAQKCMRVSGKHNDLQNVGPSFRHHTFFEMLGNFSFGDYFKEDAIALAWTLLTEEWKLPADRLYVTIFKGDAGVPRDDAAFTTWRGLVPADRIGELGAADNFWQMGDTGPCGRCSEIYYFRGSDLPCASEVAGGRCRGLECDCDRFIEVWNNVFMEFDRQVDGTLSPLPAPSIDTGMGLERITAVMQGHLSNYETDLFTPILDAIGERASSAHGGTMTAADVSMRVIADHLRSMTFLIADGVVPSNEWRGYVLRKIMRRAMRHGRRLGIEEPYLHTLVDTVVREFGQAYPELATNRDAVVRVVESEEERFGTVLTEGLPKLEDALDRAAAAGGVLAGDAAFRLYDTFGLPRDFIEDMVEDRGLRLDTEGFEKAMAGQREQARAKSTFKGRGAGAETPWTTGPATQQAMERAGEQVFRGYEMTSLASQVVAVFGEDRAERAALAVGDSGFVALAETPFYVEAGGQVSDVGTIVGPQGEVRVTAVAKAKGWPRLHAVQVERGTFAQGDAVTATVTPGVRDAIRRNHTATHLLHAALRQVLGPHVKQAGSLVAPDRLRFDFVHFTAVTKDELAEIVRLVNEHILRNVTVTTEVKRTDEAIAAGATALFGEKYGDTVRVVSVPGFSTELCGGTHVRATGDIGLFAFSSESGVAAGIRRIEAVTGFEAFFAFERYRDEVVGIAGAINAHPGQLVERIGALLDENKRLARALQQAKLTVAMGGGGGATAEESVVVAGVTLVARRVDGVDKDAMRALVDQHRDRIKSGVVVLASLADGKVLVVVGVTSDLVKRIPAGQVVKQLAPIVGGGGGGRPDFAEAGGKYPDKIAEMLAASRDVVARLLSP